MKRGLLDPQCRHPCLGRAEAQIIPDKERNENLVEIQIARTGHFKTRTRGYALTSNAVNMASDRTKLTSISLGSSDGCK